jgi:hypothetical protein
MRNIGIQVVLQNLFSKNFLLSVIGTVNNLSLKEICWVLLPVISLAGGVCFVVVVF